MRRGELRPIRKEENGKRGAYISNQPKNQPTDHLQAAAATANNLNIYMAHAVKLCVVMMMWSKSATSCSQIFRGSRGGKIYKLWPAFHNICCTNLSQTLCEQSQCALVVMVWSSPIEFAQRKDNEQQQNERKFRYLTAAAQQQGVAVCCKLSPPLQQL